MRSPGFGVRSAVLTLVITAAVLATVSAQIDVTDAQLDAASGGATIRLGTLADGKVAAVPLETYVARVLAGEGEPRAADAAQQALAVAIRTFALANAGRHAADGYDLCDSTHCQVLRASTPASRRAALATAGRILTYNGKPAEVFYSASCGGRTERASDVWAGADFPYLQVVDDGDVHEDDAPWTIDLPLSQIQQALARGGFDGTLGGVEPAARSSSGRVTRLTLRGMRPDSISGDQFRGLVGAAIVRSTAFEIDARGRTLRFTGRGYGHGVGMCVIGAGRRALRGESVERILGTYFPGLTITDIREPGSGIREPGSGNRDPGTGIRSDPASRPVVPRPAAPEPRTPDPGSPIPDPGSPIPDPALMSLVNRAHAELSKATGISVAPITAQMHPTLDSFRQATGQPWWVSVVASGTAIQLAPESVLAQREGVEAAVRLGVAELLVAAALSDRPAWVRVGAARYFANGSRGTAPPNVRQCPSDTELTLAVSAVAQREAEVRAEACFVRGLARYRNWRDVR